MSGNCYYCGGDPDEVKDLRKLLDETVRERETYNSYHQTAVIEIDRLRNQLVKRTEALKKARDFIAGFANPKPIQNGTFTLVAGNPTQTLLFELHAALTDDLSK